MSWLQRVFLLMTHSGLQPEPALGGYAMNLVSPSSSSYTGQILPRQNDKLLKTPPIEYLGLKGEYDPQGLAKRVAYAFDHHPQIRHINTLCILQRGNQIGLLGKVETAQQLQQVIELARQVEGTKDVDISQVVVEDGLR